MCVCVYIPGYSEKCSWIGKKKNNNRWPTKREAARRIRCKRITTKKNK